MLFTGKINSNRDFVSLYKKGQTVIGKYCVCYIRKNNTPYNRIGITSSKKIGNAVKRNRARRIIRAAYRNIEIKLPMGFDIIVVARTAATTAKSVYVEEFFRNNLIKAMMSYGKKSV